MIPNADQADQDNDLIGDTCDDDVDGDGVNSDEDCDDTDPSIAEPRPYYPDSDEDGYGDGRYPVLLCESVPPDGYVDEGTDNCPLTFNPDQADIDSDGIGDACEAAMPTLEPSLTPQPATPQPSATPAPTSPPEMSPAPTEDISPTPGDVEGTGCSCDTSPRNTKRGLGSIGICLSALLGLGLRGRRRRAR